ncbi:MAG TPA: DUF5677 domain-containing protein [Gallionellaceae bacterium]|nr:DUF5677 domain-containing protein [Gallionellaceae bacterium]
MSDLKRMLAIAKQLKGSLDELLFQVKVNDSGEARVSATIHLSVGEQFAATIYLIEGGYSHHAPIMVRSMLEGFANLMNLVKDPRFLDQINYENAVNDLKMFDSYLEDPAIQQDKEATANLLQWKANAMMHKDQMTAKGCTGKQSVWEKCKNAHILSAYVSYRTLSAFAHGQLTILLARHAGNSELRYHDEAPIETTASILRIAASIFRDSFNNMIQHYTNVDAKTLEATIEIADSLIAELNQV